MKLRMLLLSAPLLTITGVLHADSRLTIEIVDESGNRLPSRIHLRDDRGEPVLAADVPGWHDHFVCDGEVTLSLSPERYDWEIERGPEYLPATGSVRLTDADRRIRVTLQRIARLREHGWYSGDLHIHRPVEHVPLLMQAEDLDVGPVITWWNDQNVWQNTAVPATTRQTVNGHRLMDVMAGEDEREGGALLFFGLSEPLAITGASREYPSPVTFIDAAHARHPDVHIDIEKPFWWDVPVWVADGRVDSIGIANNHMCRSRMLENEAWGRPRDVERLPAPRGNGFWTQEIWYHLLNCGLRLPPSAGSASGVLPNPVGYNRVYVHLDGEFTWDRWWEGLRGGRSFVTNGPLLQVTANGRKPGHVFRSDGEPVRLTIRSVLQSAEPLARVEVIRDGVVAWSGDPGIVSTSGSSAEQDCELVFRESGWFVVRAIADNPRTFRFASTAPFYVEVGDTPRRISRRSVEFFLDWLHDRRARVTQALPNAEQRAEVLAFHDAARVDWLQRFEAANAD